jgi:hypothetical protein
MRSSQLHWLLIAGCAVCAAPHAALAQAAPISLRVCVAESDDARRLACYDREMARVSEEPYPAAKAQDEFGMEAELRRKKEQERSAGQPSKPRQLLARTSKVSQRPDGLLVVTLDNGQVWQQTEPAPAFHVDSGDEVKVNPGVLGSYWMTAPSRQSARFKRVR